MSIQAFNSKGRTRSLLGLICFGFLFLIGCSSSEQAQKGASKTAAIEAFTVKMGDASTDLKATSSHNFSLDAIKSGQTEFSIDGDSGKAFVVQLSSQDVASLLAGSTVMTQAADSKGSATKAVSLWVQMTEDEAEEDSGW